MLPHRDFGAVDRWDSRWQPNRVKARRIA